MKLRTINGQVFAEVSTNYLLHIGSKEFVKTLSPVELVLLIKEKATEKGFDGLFQKENDHE